MIIPGCRNLVHNTPCVPLLATTWFSTFPGNKTWAYEFKVNDKGRNEIKQEARIFMETRISQSAQY